MFYLIDRKVVSQIAKNRFDIAENEKIFWVEAPAGVAKVGDKYENAQFVPKYSLEDRRKRMQQRLSVIFEQKLNADIAHDNHLFFADSASRSLIDQALNAEERGLLNIFPTAWHVNNEDPISVSYLTIKAVSQKLVSRFKSCYANRHVLKKAINDANDPDLVDLNSGWPT